MNLNNPAWSKINWTAGATFVAGVAAAFGASDEWREVILLGTSTVPPLVIVVLRSFFTGNGNALVTKANKSG